MIAVTIIEIPQWETVTLIEACWLLSGILAFCVSIARIRPLWHDFVVTKLLDQADLCIIARGHLRREMIRTYTAFIIIVIGIYAAYDEPLRPGPAVITITGLLITLGIMQISLLVVVQSIWDWRDRFVLREMLRNE